MKCHIHRLAGRRPCECPTVERSAQILHVVVLTCLLLGLSACSSDQHLSFLNPQGPIAAAERTHFLVVVGILAVFVALPIFLFLPWVLWRYRYRATASAYRPGWKSNLPLEIFTW